MTRYCKCGKPFRADASGRHIHRLIFGHPAVEKEVAAWESSLPTPQG